MSVSAYNGYGGGAYHPAGASAGSGASAAAGAPTPASAARDSSDAPVACTGTHPRLSRDSYPSKQYLQS